jgi:hypothetical protein
MFCSQLPNVIRIAIACMSTLTDRGPPLAGAGGSVRTARGRSRGAEVGGRRAHANPRDAAPEAVGRGGGAAGDLSAQVGARGAPRARRITPQLDAEPSAGHLDGAVHSSGPSAPALPSSSPAHDEGHAAHCSSQGMSSQAADAAGSSRPPVHGPPLPTPGSPAQPSAKRARTTVTEDSADEININPLFAGVQPTAR